VPAVERGGPVRALVVLAACLLAAGGCRRSASTGARAVAVDLVEAFAATDSAGPMTEIHAGDRRATSSFVEGWSPPARDEDGRDVAWASSPRASIAFDAGTRPLDMTIVLDCVLAGEPARPRFVFIRTNGRPAGRFKLERGAQELRIAVLPSYLQPGRNVLDVLMPGYPASPGHRDSPMKFGVRALRFETSAAPAPVATVEGDRLILGPGTVATYFLRLPDDARLRFESGDRSADRLRVAVQADGRPERVAAVARAEPGHLIADLGPESGSIARIVLSADGTNLALVRPRIEGRSVESAPTTPPAARGSNVILYVADTLRADRLGCFGYARPTSPRLDAFARESLVFETAMAQASWTRPSTASILTGRYPAEHGARSLMSAVRADLPTLATILAGAGYDTAAFVTNLNVAARFGFDRGFAEYHYLEEREDRDTVYVSAAELNAAAFPWLDARGDRPFFLYLHATDTHAPYRPPPGYAERFLPPDVHPTIGPRTPVVSLIERPALATPDNIALLSAQYDGEVALLDESFGALLDHLRARGLDRSTLVVFVADHGEEFHEHGGFDHGRTLYQELVRVPLLVRLPAGASGGRRLRGLARQIDVLPTVLAVLGVERPADLPGRVLVDGGLPADETMMETQLGRPALTGVVAGPWKAVWGGTTRPGGERIELYDLGADPGERQNLAEGRPVVVGYARQTAARLRLGRASQEPAAETTVVDPDTERRLRALGYVDAGAR